MVCFIDGAPAVGGKDMEKAAQFGEPSYVWRQGQERRYEMIRSAAGDRLKGLVLENGCGVGMYVRRLALEGGRVVGLEYDFERARQAQDASPHVINAAGETLPFESDLFDFVLSHEVLEHVLDDRLAASEMVRTLRPGGRLAVFVPNRGYPFETHGVYWRGEYRFGNVPLVNYLPSRFRNVLAPHVRVYSAKDLEKLFRDLPVKTVSRGVIFGAYDNIIARFPKMGKLLRAALQSLESTPIKVFGLSLFYVYEKEG
jgi:SAM-dependent methyltransferase